MRWLREGEGEEGRRLREVEGDKVRRLREGEGRGGEKVKGR